MSDIPNNQNDKENQESNSGATSYHQTPVGTKPKPSRKLQRKIERTKRSRRRDPR